MRKDLIKRWIESQLIILYPITPHFCDIMWKNFYLPGLEESERKDKPELVSYASYPETKKEDIDFLILKKAKFLEKLGSNLRSSYERFKSKCKKDVEKIYFIIAENFRDWQVQVLEILKKHQENKQEGGPKNPWVADMKELFKGDKSKMKKAMSFASFKMKEFQTIGSEALDSEIHFSASVLIKSNMSYICKEIIDPSFIEIVLISEIDKCPNKSVQKSAHSCLPGKPLIIIDF